MTATPEESRYDSRPLQDDFPWTDVTREAFCLLDKQLEHDRRLRESGLLYKAVQTQPMFERSHIEGNRLWRAMAYRHLNASPHVTPTLVHHIGIRIAAIKEYRFLDKPAQSIINIGRTTNFKDPKPNTFAFDEGDLLLVKEMTDELDELRENDTLPNLSPDMTYIRGLPPLPLPKFPTR